MGKYIPTKEEIDNPELYKKNYAKRAKLRAICAIVVYTMAVLGMIALIALKECGGAS